MTTRANKSRKAAATVRKTQKLALSKKTLSDLTPGKRQGGVIRGGVAGSHNQTCGWAGPFRLHIAC